MVQGGMRNEKGEIKAFSGLFWQRTSLSPIWWKVGLTRLREPASNNFFSLLKWELTCKQQMYLYGGDNLFILGTKTKIQQEIIIY